MYHLVVPRLCSADNFDCVVSLFAIRLHLKQEFVYNIDVGAMLADICKIC